MNNAVKLLDIFFSHNLFYILSKYQYHMFFLISEQRGKTLDLIVSDPFSFRGNTF